MATSSSNFVFELSGWTQLEMRGVEAQTFFNNFATQDFKGLVAGQQRESFVCDIKGRILAHVQALVTEDGLAFIGGPETATILVPHLTRYLLGAEISFREQSEKRLLLLHGEQAISQLEYILAQPVERDLDSFRDVEFQGTVFRLIPTRICQSPSLLLSGTELQVSGVLALLQQASVATATASEFDFARILAGFPIVGQDVGPANLAQEAARTSTNVSFKKGCYLGQEPIARLDAMGHTNKELRSLKISGVGVLENANVIFEGQPVGVLTSLSTDESAQESVALAMIKTKANQPGTEVFVESENGPLAAKVFWNN